MSPIQQMVKYRYEGIQTLLGECFEHGCKFLSLLSIIEEVTGQSVDLIQAIRVCMQNNWLSPSFTVNDNIAILQFYTGHKWSRTDLLKQLPPVIQDNQYTEVCYKHRFTHFRRRYFDTLVNSATVANGKIQGYYVYTMGGAL